MTEDQSVEPWMESVASVLTSGDRKEGAYTLGEAVHEYGLWARTARDSPWANTANRNSLLSDLELLAASLGPRLSELVGRLLWDIRETQDRARIADIAADFALLWASPSAVRATFADLEEAAKGFGSRTRTLQPLARALASHLGEISRPGFGQLGEIASALRDPPEMLSRRHPSIPRGKELVTTDERMALVDDVLTNGRRTGNVVVWLVYRRARVSSFKTSVGDITFFSAEWYVPNAVGDDGQDFPERDEFRRLLSEVWWKDDIVAAAADTDDRFALVKVDLGVREAPGAAEEARNRVEAILSIAVSAGGVSWENTGTYTVLLDGRIFTSSVSLRKKRAVPFEDTYGMGATAEILDEISGRLGEAMARAPMPASLVEALASIRSARMTDHRDVRIYGASEVTPRLASAHEDHALESIATFGKLSPDLIATALGERETERLVEAEVLNGLLAPFRRRLRDSHFETRDALEREFTAFERDGAQIVDVAKLIAAAERIRALPMPDLDRADFEAGMAAASNAREEERLRKDMTADAQVARARHRRVRNAVTHGNPLSTAALLSTRAYAERVSDGAINLALESFASGRSIESMLISEAAHYQRTRERLAQGISFVDRQSP